MLAGTTWNFTFLLQCKLLYTVENRPETLYFGTFQLNPASRVFETLKLVAELEFSQVAPEQNRSPASEMPLSLPRPRQVCLTDHTTRPTPIGS